MESNRIHYSMFTESAPNNAFCGRPLLVRGCLRTAFVVLWRCMHVLEMFVCRCVVLSRIRTHLISVFVLTRSASDPAFAASTISFADFALSRAFTASASAASCCARASSRSDSALLSASFSSLWRLA